MRRLIIGAILCVGATLFAAGIAGAQTYPPGGEGPTGVGGEVVTNDPGASSGSSGSSSGALPFTGSDGTSALVLVGVGAAVIGGGLVIMTQRRRASSLGA